MRTALPKKTSPTRSHRPRAVTVFAAAFVAGAAAAVGVNRTLDVRLAQSKPRVESEAIFVALRSLPQGSPVTVWDVALRDWPKAMMPATALRACDTFSGHVLKHPLREGQPLLSIQLAPSGQGSQPAAEPTAFPPPAAYTQTSTPALPNTDGDLWSPAEPVTTPVQPPAAQSSQAVSQAAPAPTQHVLVSTPETTPPTDSPVATTPASEVAQQHPAEAVDTLPAETAANVSTTVGPGLADSTAAAIDTTPAPEATTTTDLSKPADRVAAPVAAPVVSTTAAPTPEPVSPPAAEPQPHAVVPEPAVPTATASSDVAPPATAALPSHTAEPVVADSVQPLPTVATTVAPPAPPAPVDQPRPAHARYLVVPESIAVQADASFAGPAATQPRPAAAQASAGTQPSSRSASNAVKPLPPTTTADRASQARTPASPHGRPPQRQGRQTQPATPGMPSNTPPQPRLGAAMFPNISAGIDAIEGRIRREQPAQGQAPADASRPVTAR